MSAHPQPRLTPEQYLEIERAAQDARSEYYNGRMYAMSGGHPHAIVTGNIARRLGNALERQPCMVTTSDLRVRVSKSGLYTYPDVVVVCAPPRYVDDRHDTLLNPA
jgi:Uma2 family endonuclease